MNSSKEKRAKEASKTWGEGRVLKPKLVKNLTRQAISGVRPKEPEQELKGVRRGNPQKVNGRKEGTGVKKSAVAKR